MSEKRVPKEWWTVKLPADVSEATEEQLSSLGSNQVGLSGKTAWIDAMHLRETREVENSLSTDDICANYGFVDLDEEWSSLPDERVLLWMPQTKAQAETVKEDLDVSSLADSSVEDNINGYLTASLKHQEVSCIVSIPEGSRKATGIIGFHRKMHVYEDDVTIDYHVRVFHSVGTKVERGALLAGLHSQMRTDMETAFTSLASAGLDLPLKLVVHDCEDDSEMLPVFQELAELACNEAFDLHIEDLPDWISMEQYVANIGGQVLSEPQRAPSLG